MPARYLFVVTYGRTGSTLLQGILNAHPGVRIFGENKGFLHFLFRAIRSLEDARDLAPDPRTERPDHPFYGSRSLDLPATEARLVEVARSFLEDRRGTARVIGFKEIRYDMPDLEDYLRWLDRTFPEAVFVALTRPVSELKGSGFWKGADERLLTERVRHLERTIDSLARQGALRIVSLTYADVANGSDVVERLLREIGVEPDRPAIDEILQRPHSYMLESVVFYDNSRLFLRREVLEPRFLSYRVVSGRLDAGNQVISGALLPKVPGNEVASVWLERDADSADRCVATLGLPSPQLAAQFPDHPLSGRAQFELRLPAEAGLYRMFVSAGGETLEIGTLLCQPRSTRVFAE